MSVSFRFGLFAFVVLCVVSPVMAKRLAGKNVSEISVLCRAAHKTLTHQLIFHGVDQSCLRHSFHLPTERWPGSVSLGGWFTINAKTVHSRLSTDSARFRVPVDLHSITELNYQSLRQVTW